MKLWQIWLLGILAVLSLGYIFSHPPHFGDVPPIDVPPIIDTPPEVPNVTDQDIYNTILAAEKNGDIPSFTVDETSDLSRISAQYIQVAKDNGVDTSKVTPTDEKNLYVATRNAMTKNGDTISPMQDVIPTP